MIGPLVRLLKRSSGLALATIMMPISAVACGLNWNEPKSHFEGVSFQGYVFLVQNLGEIDAGSGLTLPLRAIFRSGSNATSPYVGYGWDIPLLESHIVQLDERWFRMVEPTGWYRLFWRDKKNPNILHGQNGWKGEIRGNQIVTWANCGSKLVFTKGRITSVQLKDRKLDYIYKDDRVESVTEAGATIIKVESDTMSGTVTGLRMKNNKRIGLERNDRPRIQVVNRQSLVNGIAKSLSKITFEDGSINTIHYGFSECSNPTLVAGERLFKWSSISHEIIQDNEWIYSVKRNSGFFENAIIERKNSENQKELWNHDGAKGIEHVQTLDGTKTTRKWFPTGKLLGKPRGIKVINAHGEKATDSKFIYGEDGRILLEKTNGALTNFLYKDGELIPFAKLNSNTPIWVDWTSNDQKRWITLLNGVLRVRLNASDSLIAEIGQLLPKENEIPDGSEYLEFILSDNQIHYRAMDKAKSILLSKNLGSDDRISTFMKSMLDLTIGKKFVQ